MIISRRTRWSAYVARVGENENAYKFWLINLKVRGHLEDLGVHEGIIIIKLTLKK